jgi:hypothetical protein
MPDKSPILLIDKATGAGIGAVKFDTAKAHMQHAENHTVEVWARDFSAITVRLLGSITGVKWASLGTYELTAEDLAAGVAMFHIKYKNVRYVRGEIVSAVNNGAGVCSMFYEPSPW